jgi:DNA-binding MarR family transcriptional regulator
VIERPPTRTPRGGESSREVVIPALLRAARGAYARAITARLERGGFDDVPRTGPFILGGMANHGAAAADLIRELGVTKQATSQLIDTLVLRGYLTREVNPEDRRRLNIALTERGRAAAVAVRDGIAEVDAELAASVSPEDLRGLRTALAALAEIKDRRSTPETQKAKPT